MIEDNKKILLHALRDAQVAVERKVAKKGSTGGKAPFSHYVGHEHVIDHVSQAMLDHGLLLTLQPDGEPMTRNIHTGGGERTVMLFPYSATLWHVDGASIPAGGCVGTATAGDKAGYIANTAACRAILLRLFALAGADEDVEAGEHIESSGPAPRQAAAPTQQTYTSVAESAPAMGFGRDSGKPLHLVDDEGLRWYQKALRENIANPDKSRFREKNQKDLGLVETELDRRRG